MKSERKSSKTVCGIAAGLWLYTFFIYMIGCLNFSGTAYRIYNFFATVVIFLAPVIAFVMPVVLFILFSVQTIDERKFKALPFFTLIINIGYSILLYNMLESWF